MTETNVSNSLGVDCKKLCVNFDRLYPYPSERNMKMKIKMCVIQILSNYVISKKKMLCHFEFIFKDIVIAIFVIE